MPCWKLSLTWVSQISGGLWPAQHFLLPGASQIWDFVDSLGTFYSLRHPKFEISLTCSALSTLWAIPNSGFCWLAQHFLLPGASQIQDFVDSLDTFYSLGHPKFEISLTCSMFSLFQGIPNLNFSYLVKYFLIPKSPWISIFVDSLSTFFWPGHPKFRISLTRSALSTLWDIPNSRFCWLARHFLLSEASQIRNFVDSLSTFYSLGHPKFEISLTRSALSTLWDIPNSEFRWPAQCFPSSRVSQTSISVTSSSTFSFLSHPGSQFSLTCLALSHSLVTLDLDFRWPA